MALAERDGDVIVVKTEYRDKDLIRAVPGATYKVADHAWTVPLSWAACISLRGMFRERLEVGPALNAWAAECITEYINPAMVMRDALDAPGDSALYPFQRAGVKFLAHSQRALLTDEMGTGKTIQTIRALAEDLANGTNPFPALIVCPNSMKRTWAREFKTWWPGVICVIMEGGRVARIKQIEQISKGKAHVLIANWESLRGHSRLAPYGSTRLKRCVVCDATLRDQVETAKVDLEMIEKRVQEHEDTIKEYQIAILDAPEGELLAPLPDPILELQLANAKKVYKDEARKHSQNSCEWCKRELNKIPWTAMVADEAHKGKEPKAKQTRALWALATDSTVIRYALTGTPIANAPQDLWSALHFIDPKSWPTRTKYIDRWCLTSYNPFGGMTVIGLKPETKDEFFRIVDPYVRRMPKSLVLKDLPPKVYSTRYVEMLPKQRKAYEMMRDEMVSQLTDAGGGERLVAVNPLTQLTRLGQFASSFAELITTYTIDPNTGQQVPTVTVRLTDPSNKIDELMEILEEMRGEPIGVFAQSRQLIELASARLTKAKIAHGMIVGNQTSDERQSNVDRFQAGEFAAVLATVGAGGIGITLTRGSTCVFLQRSWSMIENKQAEDRFHRIGSEIHESVNIIDIVSQGTIEEGQRLALDAKTDRMQEIVRDRELLERVLRGELTDLDSI